VRILIQNSVFYPNVIGGAEQSSWMLGLRLSARGHHVDAVATTGRRRDARDRLYERELEGLSGRVYEAASHGYLDLLDTGGGSPGIGRKVAHHAANVRSRRWRRLLDDLFARLRPDVVHTNTIVGMTGVVWDAAHAAGVPVVHTLRDYHLLCPRTTLLRSSGVECVDAPWPCRVYRRFKRGSTAHVDVVTAPSRFVLQRHLDHEQFPHARPEVVPNAGPPRVEPRPHRPPDTTVTGLYLGQLDAHKGVGVLLDTLTEWFEDRSRPELHFRFAGAGPMASEVRSFCGRWPHHAHFDGFVEDYAKNHLLSEVDFLVVPSIWNDNFPRVMIDAFRYGHPVIGARRGGIPEVVEHESNGLLVEPTVGELRNAMRRLVDRPDERERLGARAHEDARKYELEAQVDRFEKIYTELAGARRA
jgi:glycosyltransferase involved in cell wall biosynthesis